VDKRTVSTAFAKQTLNRVVKAVARLGLPFPGVALLETTGRRSGLPRHTPVGNGLAGDTFWIVAEHGRAAAYVRNIEADPRVRVRVRRRWRSGTAAPMPGDDTRARQRMLAKGSLLRRMNAVGVRAMGSDLLTIRVDLD
jgi:deazaflavin-dependent oxidoreductase (nitroreductase family)